MEFLILALKLLTYVIIGDAILSWIQPPNKFPRSLTSRLTAPLYAPIHKVLDPQKTGGFDIAPILVIVALQVISNVLARSAL
jgi:YggT family protein